MREAESGPSADISAPYSAVEHNSLAFAGGCRVRFDSDASAGAAHLCDAAARQATNPSERQSMSEADQSEARVRALSHFIDGRTVAGNSDRFGDVFNPALGAVAARVPLASADEVGAAVAAA